MTLSTQPCNLLKLLEIRNLGADDQIHNYWDCTKDTPSQALRQLLQLCIPAEELISQPLTLQRVVDLTQKHWFVRQRWTIMDTPEICSKKARIKHCYDELGYAKAVNAPDGHYSHILLLSARVNVMVGRMLSLREKIESGKITADHIYILAGTHGLYKSDKEEDEYDLLEKSTFNITSAITEEEAAVKLSEQIFKGLNIATPVLATNLLGREGQVVRPSTNDNIITWLNNLPDETDLNNLKVLVVSDPYFGNYLNNQLLPLLLEKGLNQDNIFSMAEKLSKKEFTKIGMYKEKYKIALGIDTIARMLNDWNNQSKQFGSVSAV